MSDNEDYTDDELYDEDESDLDEIIDKEKNRVGFLSKCTYKEIKNFIRFSLKTIFIFWVVFPFYSYQLQMFYDQKICNKESKDPSKNNCQIPYVSYKSPYGDGTKPPERPKRKKKGWFSWMSMPGSGIISDQVANGAAASAKIEVATSHNTDQNSNTKVNEQTISLDGGKGGFKGGGQKGGRKEEFNLEETRYTVLYNVLNECLGVNKDGLQTAEKCDKLHFLKTPRDLKKEKSFTDVFCAKGDRSNKDDEELIKWPYTYIRDYEKLLDKTEECKKDIDSLSCAFQNPLSWYKAWFAEIQKTSWSTTKWIISFILLKIKPFVSSDFDEWLIKCKTASFIDTLTLKIDEYKLVNQKEANKLKILDSSPDSDVKTAKITKINEYINNTKNVVESLTQVRDTFRDGILKSFIKIADKRDSDYKNIEKFIEKVMKNQIVNEGQRLSTAGVTDDPKNLKYNNIYTDFLISALKPEEPKIQGKNHKFPTVFTPLNSTGKNHWKRYILTWFMWAITLGIVAISSFTGFWMTVFGSFNKYSYLLLPLLSYMLLFGLSMYNAIAQPISLLFYSLFGFSELRTSDIMCPNSSGSYQMKKNNSQYYGINMFITLFLIVTYFGVMVTKISKSGSNFEIFGYALIAIFPLATLVIIFLKVINVIKWLFSKPMANLINKWRKSVTY